MLRKAEERTVSGLWDLIGKLVDIFQPDECANYFSSCGCEPECPDTALILTPRGGRRSANLPRELCQMF